MLVSVTNVDLDGPVEVELRINGATLSGATGRLLWADCANAYNRPGAADTVSPVRLDLEQMPTGLRLTLPPHSFATVSATIQHA
jgi:alpha-N-arabinofuranosidase